jgi:hypothetical protein
MKPTFLAVATGIYFAFATPALAETHIRVVPIAAASATPLSKPACSATTADNPSATESELPNCDANLFAPGRPTNYALTFSLQPAYQNLQFPGPTKIELFVRRADFPEGRFRNFDIQMPAEVRVFPFSGGISDRMHAVCTGAPSPEALWQGLLWANFAEQLVPGTFDASYKPQLDLLIYVSCRGLLENERTSATVAASIRSDGLSLCPAELQQTLAPAAGYGEACRATSAMPNTTLGVLAGRYRETFLTESIQEQRQHVQGQAILTADDTTRTQYLSDALATERATRGDLSVADGAFLAEADRSADSSMNNLLLDSVQIQTRNLPSGAPLDFNFLARARELSATASSFRAASAPRPFEEQRTDAAFATFYQRAAGHQLQVIQVSPDAAAQSVAAQLGADYRAFSSTSVLNPTTLAPTQARVEALETAARSAHTP